LEETVGEMGMSEYMLKLKEQDNFSDTGFQVTIRHEVLRQFFAINLFRLMMPMFPL